METNVIHTGDCLDVLDTLPADSVHAVVTDPPYGLAFMGRSWDDFEPREYQEWCEKWAQEAKRVLKPGGHLLAFSGSRTHHRLFSGVEDAGFEIRDTLTWHYGSGFPKALDVSKAIQKAEGIEPEKIEKSQESGLWRNDSDWNNCYHQHTMPEPEGEAKKWDGFKTALKPATEFVVMARKPFEGTVAENVQAHGTAALNIDGTRIGEGSDDDRTKEESAERRYIDDGGTNFAAKPGPRGGSDKGRYPANVIFDETQANELDRQNPTTEGSITTSKPFSSEGSHEGYVRDAPDNYEHTARGFDDSGGVSRYFYTSKATRAERTLDGKIDNAHPTVKPQDLMEWLVKLVTAENQIVLDPFCGTGTTCKAAKDLGQRFIGIEQQAKWADVARVRCGLTPDDPSNVRSDDAQQGLESY